MEITFLVYFQMHESGTVFYLLYESNATELVICGQVHTTVFLIALIYFYLRIKLTHTSPHPLLPTHTHTHTESSLGSKLRISMTDD